MIKYLCLDLEGTLISSGVSQFSRPGLYYFLNELLKLDLKLICFSSLSTNNVQKIIEFLIQEGEMPYGSQNIRCLEWDRKQKFKDLKFTGYPIDQVLLLDDQIRVVVPEQLSQAIIIKEWEHPYSRMDVELYRTLDIIKNKL